MKHILLIISLIIGVIGCASKPSYRAAEKNGFGYFHSELGENRYRVHFKMKGTSRVSAMDYALLRAAELTQERRFDWFIVVDRQTVTDKGDKPKSSISANQHSNTVTKCGLLGCSSSTQPSRQVGGHVQFGSDDAMTESIIEIRLGKGIRPQEGSSYDAQAIIEAMNQQLTKE
jgi:hypothetical protein